MPKLPAENGGVKENGGGVEEKGGVVEYTGCGLMDGEPRTFLPLSWAKRASVGGPSSKGGSVGDRLLPVSNGDDGRRWVMGIGGVVGAVKGGLIKFRSGAGGLGVMFQDSCLCGIVWRLCTGCC